METFSNHVEVRQCGQRRPENAARTHRANPEEIGQLKDEDGDALVIVRTSHRTTDVAGH